MQRVDAHLHVWRAAEADTPGIQTIVPPQTDVPIERARETMFEHGVDRAVLVQPVFRGEDNRYVAACARQEPGRFAAVCVVDPRTAGAEARLAHWAGQGCRGLRLRPRIAEEEKIFGDASTWPLWQAAERLRVVVSLLSSPQHAPAIAALAERFASVAIIIDHLGDPDVREGAASAGFRDVLSLARYANVSLKVSGMYHFSAGQFPFVDCWPLVQAAYDAFGPDRLVWGSDFPHVVLRCGYERAVRLPDEALARLSQIERDRIMGGNAVKLYWPQGG